MQFLILFLILINSGWNLTVSSGCEVSNEDNPNFCSSAKRISCEFHGCDNIPKRPFQNENVIVKTDEGELISFP